MSNKRLVKSGAPWVLIVLGMIIMLPNVGKNNSFATLGAVIIILGLYIGGFFDKVKKR